MDSVAVNIIFWCLCPHACISLGYVPRTEIVGSYGNSVYDTWRNCQAVFSSKGLHQGDSDFSASSLHSCDGHPQGGEVLSHCGFSLHAPHG